MRRLSTYFALSLIWAGLLAPFVSAAQLSPVPACCRRNGMHHCQMYSRSSRDTGREAGFQSPRPKCPYATPLTLAALTAVEPARFNLSTPATAGFVAPAPFHRAHAPDLHNRTARGPPPSLL
jgi:hypothetical protein